MQDQKANEELCIQKYQSYSNQAQDPQLKQLFSNINKKEQEHLNTVNQIISGQVPNMQQNAMSGQQSQQNQQNSAQNSTANQNQQNKSQNTNQNDKTMCTDMLSTEKFVSGAYDTAIFECVDPNVRQTLNHIQKEEQEHGEQIFNYMKCNGMYNPQ